MKQVALSVLVDDKPGNGLSAEHGLSLFIETPEIKILFDAGQTDLCVTNARVLGMPLEKTDFFVLSHGHYDHTGGLSEVLPLLKKARVYAGSGLFTPRYSLKNHQTRKTGMSRKNICALNSLGSDRFRWVTEPVLLDIKAGLTGPVPRRTDFESAGEGLFLDENGEKPDTVREEQSLWIGTPRGLVVVTGCCHAGLVNTLAYVRKLHPDEQIRAVIGGFHLDSADDERLKKTTDYLKRLDLEILVSLHCTGDRAELAFADALAVFQSNRTGDRIVLE